MSFFFFFLFLRNVSQASPSQQENVKVFSIFLSLSFSALPAIFQLHFIYHNLLTLIYRYTATRHICMRHRNLHWPSLNVTVLLNDQSTDRGLSLERGPRHGNSGNFHASRDSWSQPRRLKGIRTRYAYRKIVHFAIGTGFTDR